MGQSSEHHDSEHGHHGSSTPPGMQDIAIGAVVFYLLTHGVFWVVANLIDPNLFSVHALHQMQLSGGLFILLWVVLGRGVFEPFLASAVHREEATQGVFKRAQAMKDASRKLAEEVDAALRGARLQGVRQRDGEVAEARVKATALLEKAQAENSLHLSAATETLAEMKVAAQKQLSQETEKLSKLVVEQVLGAGGNAPLH